MITQLCQTQLPHFAVKVHPVFPPNFHMGRQLSSIFTVTDHRDDGCRCATQALVPMWAEFPEAWIRECEAPSATQGIHCCAMHEMHTVPHDLVRVCTDGFLAAMKLIPTSNAVFRLSSDNSDA